MRTAGRTVLTARRWLAGVMMCLLAWAGVYADTVYLVGGGSFTGKVREEGERVVVEIPDGSITLDRERVLRIEYGQDLPAELAKQRSGLDPRDAAGHYRVGLWAAQHNLTGPARELCAAAVRIQPTFVPAQVALGRVFLDGAWQEPDAQLDIMRQWLQEGLNTAVLQVGRQALSKLLSSADRRATLELMATSGRRMGYFAQALADYRELIAIIPQTDGQYERLAATVELLKDHPTGLYLVQADELVSAVARLDSDEPTQSGFYSLADDLVLEYALRDRAKALINQGQTTMAAAKAAEVADSARAVVLYSQAEDPFARADALVPDIARSYRVEVRRRLIQIRQSAAEALALRFDAMNKQLPVAVRNKQVYRAQLKQMLALLDEIQKELNQILALAGPYPQELNLAITWTHEDLATVKAMRKTLESEQERLGTGR